MRELVDKHGRTDKWYSKYSMRIDNINNAKNMGDQTWPGNADINRDSVGTCNKYACLKLRPKVVADWDGWKKRASKQIQSAQGELTTQLKKLMNQELFLYLQEQLQKINDEQEAKAKAMASASNEQDPKTANQENHQKPVKKKNNIKIPEDQTYPGLLRAIFSLDTVARVGYGNDLEGQEELAEYLKTILELKDVLLNTASTYAQKAEAIKKAVDEQISLNDLPLKSGPVVGWGIPDLRHKALNLISQRNYLSPSACHYLKEDL